jgi:hypothetical protein
MFVAVSLTVLSILGLGFPFWRWDAPLRRLSMQSVGTIIGRGLLLGYAIGLVTPSIHSLPYLFGVPIVAAAWMLTHSVRRHGFAIWLSRAQARESDIVGGFVATIAISALFFKITTEEISAWDARSIWYFHAKILHHISHALNGKLWISIGWSHQDYPKLNAMWAAFWMLHFPGWNEFLPKFSLVLLWTPAVLLCTAFSTSLITRLGLLAILILRGNQFVWNGMMDAMLATYAGLAVLYGGRYVLRGSSLDLMTVLVASGMCAGLKNEGFVFAACCVFFTFVARECQLILQRGVPWRRNREVATTALYSFAGPLTWAIFTSVVGLSNDLTSAGSKGDRLRSRLNDGKSLEAIWTGITPPEDQQVFFFLLAVMLVYWVANWRQFARYRAWLLFSLCVPGVYLATLILVYLTTPWDITWHLLYSVDRTGLVLHAAVIMAFLGPVLAETRSSLPLTRFLSGRERPSGFGRLRGAVKPTTALDLGSASEPTHAE